MMTTIDVSSKIERLEVFEERLGVSLESLSAFVEESPPGYGYIMLKVRGELQPRNGTQLRQDIRLKVTAYGSSKRIIGTSSDRDAPKFSVERFFGLAAFEVEFWLPVTQVSKVRVYPKKG